MCNEPFVVDNIDIRCRNGDGTYALKLECKYVKHFILVNK